MPQKMCLNTHPKSVSFALKTLSAAVLSTLLVANVAAAGLGKLTVLSSLGQPLRAEIELTSVSKDEIGLLSPKLASIDSYRQANIDFNTSLNSLRFSVEQRGSREIISVTSTQPINEPFVDLLLELGGSGNGRLIREYTFLLDPDIHQNQAPEVVSSRTVPQARSQDTAPVLPKVDIAPSTADRAPSDLSLHMERPQQRERPGKQVASRRPTIPLDEKPVAKPIQKSGDYRVKPGDSLSKIAGQLRQEGVSLDQMLVALYRANQNAFVNNNMNRLRSGEVLAVPDAASAGSITSAEAKSVIMSQTADFNEYRNKLAGQVANSEVQKTNESRQSATGKITAKAVEKPNAVTESVDKLKLSKSDTLSEKGKAALSEEDKIARDKALADANSRVAVLEKNVTELQRLLAEQNKKQPAATDKSHQASVPPASPLPAIAATPAPPAVSKAAASASASASAASASTPPAVKPTPAKAESAKLAHPPRVIKPTPKPEPEAPWYDGLIGNPFIWWGAGLALLGGIGASVYKNRKPKEKPFGDSIITDSNLKANSLFGSTGGQSVDTNNSVFNSSFAPSANQLDTNEVDPVAEADVYIAYGRDAQAEEILKEALRTQPDRNAVRLKLLEIYANRKDVRSFEVLASELYGTTKGEGDDWGQAAALGLSIDPKNPLYASGANFVPSTAGSTQSQDDHDLDDLMPLASEQSIMESHYAVSDSPSLESTTIGHPDPDTVIRQPESQPQVSDDLPLDISSSLDFDLDGIDADAQIPESAHHQPSTPSVAATKVDFSNIDFDFMKPETPSQPAEKEPEHDLHVDEHADMNVAEIPMMSSSNESHTDFELPDIPEPTEKQAQAKEPSGLDFDLSGITLDIASADSSNHHDADDKKKDTSAAEKSIADELMDMNIPEIHSLPDLDEPKSGKDKEKDKDSSDDLMSHSIDLDLPDLMKSESTKSTLSESESKRDSSTDMPSIGKEPEVELDTGVEHEYSNNAEMATKLDLAAAYQEIGDKDGAKELLEEVMNGGVPEYAQKAKALLAKL